MYENDIFDAAVFGSLSETRSATASCKPEQGGEVNQRVDFDALLAQSCLSFASLQQADKTARVTAFERGYRVELGNERFAFDLSGLRSLLEQDNQGIDLSFSEELASYEPEEGLVRKSKVPLWVMKPVGQRVVLIQRMF